MESTLSGPTMSLPLVSFKHTGFGPARVFRVETVINNLEEFRVRKKVTRKGRSQTEWVAMRKGVARLFRYREVSLVDVSEIAQPIEIRPLMEGHAISAEAIVNESVLG